MPVLKITECEQCPYHKINREHWMDDCYQIKCDHEDAVSDKYITKKIHRGKGIYFKCPLDEN